MKCEISNITLFNMRRLIYDKSITQVRGFHERPTWVITWHTHDFCCIIYNFRLTLLHFTIHPREKELNNIFAARWQESQSMVLLLVGIQKFVYSSLFASISSMKILSLSLSLSLSYSCQTLVWDFLIALQNEGRGVLFFVFR